MSCGVTVVMAVRKERAVKTFRLVVRQRPSLDGLILQRWRGKGEMVTITSQCRKLVHTRMACVVRGLPRDRGRAGQLRSRLA